MNDKLDTNAALQAYGNALRESEAALEVATLAEARLFEARRALRVARDKRDEAFAKLQEALR